MWKKLIDKFKDLKIGTKIIVCYLIIAVISMSISTLIYQKINARIMTEKVSEMALQTLQTIDANLNLLIYTVNNESKILLSNQGIQEVLASGSEKFNYNNQMKVNRYLTEFIQSNMFISSVYIFDNYGNKFYVDKRTFQAFSLYDLRNSKWYDKLVEAKGGYIIKLTGKELYNKPNERYVSMMRIINDLDTQKPIGTMIINIPEDAIINSFKDIMKDGEAVIQLKDGNYNDIIHSNDLDQYNLDDNFKKLKTGEHFYSIKKVEGKDYITSYLRSSLNWTIVSIVPYQELSKQSNIYKVVLLAMFLFNGVLSLSGLIFTSSGITRPIHKLIKSMKGVEKGTFKKVNIATGNDEIGELKNVYNTMIQKIENLIEEIVKEQKIKRKAELDVLQSQIKPHFLYNSFDAISSLALDNRNQEVYQIIKALGNFYRTSLNNGKEVITVEEEVQTVRNYLTIMQIRYDNLFTVDMDIDERVSKYKILKLVLQPLVENSIYHGIKPTGKKGRIFIGAYSKEAYIELIVSDDGIGMDEEKLKSLTKEGTPGIGLRGTIERLNIFYNGKSKFKIDSRLDAGTTVVIYIPIEEVEDYEQ
ncbi:sensor histidine kinase [Clostridium thermarum]|uniref:sensor histidine kinase n=1 Tax=Clostridium thermarum TaxID=1716543 RepID=UPI001123B3CE|nr:sensor histidine kinase [Clostridium thermarum]